MSKRFGPLATRAASLFGFLIGCAIVGGLFSLCGGGGANQPEDGTSAIRAAQDEIALGNSGSWSAYYDRYHPDIRAVVSSENFSACRAAEESILGPLTATNFTAEDRGSHLWDVSWVGVAGNDPNHASLAETSTYFYTGGRWWFVTNPSEVALFQYGKDCAQHLSEVQK